MPDLPGGQAEALAVPFADFFALPIPEGVSDEEAVLLTDILPTGYVGALRASIRPGATVVVIGLGPVGVMALQCASLFGPARILAVDMVPERLARAERLGAEPIDAAPRSVRAQVIEATGGRGAESVIEAVGADATVLDAVSCAATGGTVSIVGVNLNMGLPFPMALVLLKSLTVRAVFAPFRAPGRRSCRSSWRAGSRGLAETFTHRLGLSRAAEAYELFDSRARRRLEGLARPEGLSPFGVVGGPVAHRRRLGVAELGPRDEPRRRRGHDQPGQLVDDRLVADPPALEVAPGILEVALDREPRRLQAAEALLELGPGETGARCRKGIGVIGNVERPRHRPQAIDSHGEAQPRLARRLLRAHGMVERGRVHHRHQAEQPARASTPGSGTTRAPGSWRGSPRRRPPNAPTASRAVGAPSMVSRKLCRARISGPQAGVPARVANRVTSVSRVAKALYRAGRYAISKASTSRPTPAARISRVRAPASFAVAMPSVNTEDPAMPSAEREVDPGVPPDYEGEAEEDEAEPHGEERHQGGRADVGQDAVADLVGGEPGRHRLHGAGDGPGQRQLEP